MNYPLAASTWDEDEYAAMRRVIESGRFTMGDEVAAFESEFAAWLGARYCIMVNSGSSANLLMIAALRYHSRHVLNPGDEVIVPAVSWSTTYFPLYQYGLRLKFVDIDRHTLNLDPGAVAAAIGPATKAILAVNLLGNPNDFSRLDVLTRQHGLILLEDNCEAMGAAFAGRQTGTFGLAGSFSTFFSHHISTMEGGMLATDDEELYHIGLALRAHGWTRNLPKHNRLTGTKGDDPFEESFRFVLPGYNLRPLELSGAIGREQIKKLPAFIARRRDNASIFLEVLAKYPYLRPQREIGASSWFGFSLVIEPAAPLDRRRMLEVFTCHGIEARPIVTGNFAKNPVLKWFDHEICGDLPAAEEIDSRGLFVGNHHFPISTELQQLERALGALSESIK